MERPLLPVLPGDVAEALGLLLAGDGPTRRALRAQVPYLRVTDRCACECGTAYFEPMAGEAAPTPAPTGPRTLVVAEAPIPPAVGEVLVFARDGYLSWLEVCSLHDDPGVTLDLALRTWRREGFRAYGGGGRVG